MGHYGKFYPRFPDGSGQKVRYCSGKARLSLLPDFAGGHHRQPKLPAVHGFPEHFEPFVLVRAEHLSRHSEFEPDTAGKLFFRATDPASERTF